MDYSSLAEQALEASKAFEAATTFQASTTLDVPNAINASKAFDASNTFDPSGIPQLLSSQEEDVATPTDKLKFEYMDEDYTTQKISDLQGLADTDRDSFKVRLRDEIKQLQSQVNLRRRLLSTLTIDPKKDAARWENVVPYENDGPKTNNDDDIDHYFSFRISKTGCSPRAKSDFLVYAKRVWARWHIDMTKPNKIVQLFLKNTKELIPSTPRVVLNKLSEVYPDEMVAVTMRLYARLKALSGLESSNGSQSTLDNSECKIILQMLSKTKKLGFSEQELALTYEDLPARCTGGWEKQVPPGHEMFGEVEQVTAKKKRNRGGMMRIPLEPPAKRKALCADDTADYQEMEGVTPSFDDSVPSLEDGNGGQGQQYDPNIDPLLYGM